MKVLVAGKAVRRHEDKTLHDPPAHLHRPAVRPRQGCRMRFFADPDQKLALMRTGQHVAAKHEAGAAEHPLLDNRLVCERAAKAIGHKIISHGDPRQYLRPPPAAGENRTTSRHLAMLFLIPCGEGSREWFRTMECLQTALPHRRTPP